MSPHQFYLRLALAPVFCFLEPWHFYLPTAWRGRSQHWDRFNGLLCSQLCEHHLSALVVFAEFWF